MTQKEIPAFYLYHKIILDYKGNVSKSTQLFINKLCRLFDEIIYVPDKKRLIYLNHETWEYNCDVIYVKGKEFFINKERDNYMIINLYPKQGIWIKTITETKFKRDYNIFKFNRKLCYLVNNVYDTKKKDFFDADKKLINSFKDRSEFVKCFLGEKIARNIPFNRYEQVVIGNKK